MSRVIAVRPLPDGVNQRGSWQVTVSGSRKSSHTKKSAAKRKARSIAREGDTIAIYGTNGRKQQSYTYTGGQSSNTNTASYEWDASGIADEYDEMTDIF